MRIFLLTCENRPLSCEHQSNVLLCTHYSLHLLTECLSYDADEVTTKAPTPAPNESSSEHKENLVPGASVPPPIESKVEAPTEKVPEHIESDIQAYGDEVHGQGGQNGGAMTWNDAQGNEDRVNNYNDASAEEESRGVGIKEDG